MISKGNIYQVNLDFSWEIIIKKSNREWKLKEQMQIILP